MKKPAILYFALLFVVLSCKPEKPAKPIDPNYARKFVGEYKTPAKLFDSSKQDIEWDIRRVSDRYIDIYNKTTTVVYPGTPISYTDTIRNVFLTDTSSFSFDYTNKKYEYTIKAQAEMIKDTLKVRMEKQWPDPRFNELDLDFIRQ